MSSAHMGPAVVFDQVYKAFGPHQVLRDVSFQVPAGQVLCILGRSGTGKSVTLKLLIALLKPDRGSIWVDGDDISRLKPSGLSKETGKLKWYYQFTPHDIHDWDAEEPPVLVDTNWQGQPRKLLIQANRNGFFYVFDRSNGQLLLAKAFLKKLNWAKEIGKDGRPVVNQLPDLPNGESYVCPGIQGGTNWYSTSFNPGTGLYYIQALERCNLYSKRAMEWEAGKGFMGGSVRPAPDEPYTKSVRALDIQTGAIAWDLPQAGARAPGSAGLMSTASALVFFGENSGSFMAADADNGKVLWEFPANQGWRASPMTYMFDNRQYVAIAAGTSIMAFALPE